MAPPFPTVPVTVDIIIESLDGKRIVIIERLDNPHGYAIPGGFVEPGESAAQAAVREAKEETGLDIELVEQFHTYSKPGRDPRGPVASVVFIAKGIGKPKGGDDAKTAGWVYADRATHGDGAPALPPMSVLAFDHGEILNDYINYKKMGIKPKPER